MEDILTPACVWSLWHSQAALAEAQSQGETLGFTFMPGFCWGVGTGGELDIILQCLK